MKYRILCVNPVCLQVCASDIGIIFTVAFKPYKERQTLESDAGLKMAAAAPGASGQAEEFITVLFYFYIEIISI